MKYRIVCDDPNNKDEIIAKECDVKDEKQLVKIIKWFLATYPEQQPRIRYKED